MIDFLTQLFSGLLGFFDSLLPGNPFEGMLTITDDLMLGLGWLNWLVPLQGMVAMATIWLMSCVGVVAVKFVLGASKKFTMDIPIGNNNGGYTS